MDAAKVRLIFARANEFKEGDLMVGGTADEALKTDARREVASMTISAIAKTAMVEDSVTEAIGRSLNKEQFNEISQLSIGRMKEILLGPDCGLWVRRFSNGLPSEVIAAVVKIMSNEELSKVTRSVFNILPGTGIDGSVMVGSERHFGSRLQPNSPGDDEEEILLSVLEGLSFGCGDVIIGLNPASDDIETIVRTEKILQSIVKHLKLPTRYCVLSDMVKQSSARRFTHIDVGFQSLAGTSKSLTGMLGLDVDGLLELSGGFDGLYFETGQGSEVTNGAAEGVDMVTLEARCYGLARYLRQQNGGKWMIVNDVAGFIGPEVFRTGAQLMRACLEDMVMAKMHGLTMGLDVCSTFHMGINPAELITLTEEIVKKAAPAYLMAVAGKADPMLGYLTTSYREHPRLKRAAGRDLSGAMKERLKDLGVTGPDGIATGDREITASLYAKYMKEGGDKRQEAELHAEALKKIARLQEKGCDLGYGFGPGLTDPAHVTTRLETLYSHARNALYATVETSVIRDSCQRYIDISTNSADREDYLAHPASGEMINEKDAVLLEHEFSGNQISPGILFVISDGLNADSVNEHLRNFLPKLKWELKEAGLNPCVKDVVIKNGRVRAGYHVGLITRAEIIVHLIGERPGTGLNQLSAYITYGKDPAGNFRWDPGMDHSFTTAICSIHPKGKTPESAIGDIIRIISRMTELHCSGVLLGKL
jgi:ethanolamine ammonia-lyase large subunit